MPVHHLLNECLSVWLRLRNRMDRMLKADFVHQFVQCLPCSSFTIFSFPRTTFGSDAWPASRIIWRANLVCSLKAIVNWLMSTPRTSCWQSQSESVSMSITHFGIGRCWTRFHTNRILHGVFLKWNMRHIRWRIKHPAYSSKTGLLSEKTKSLLD